MIRWVFPHARRWLKRIWFLFALCVVLAAMLISFFRIMTPWINHHKREVEHQLTHLLGETVSIEGMETSWSWFQPVLKLDKVLVSEQGTPVLQLNKLLVGVSLWNSVLHWQIQPGVLIIDDVQLTLRQTDQGWQVDGLKQGESLTSLTPRSYLPVLHWLLLQQKIKLTNISASVYLKDGTLIPVKSLTLQAAHHHGRYRMKGKVRLGADEKTELSMQGDIAFLSNLLETTEGELFFSAEHVQFAPLKSLFSSMPYQVTRGEGSSHVWIRYQNGHIGDIQSTLKLQDLVWIKAQQPQLKHKVEHITTNMAWKPTPSGWQWSADHVFVSTPNKTWPENALLLDYQTERQNYRLLIKKLALDASAWAFLDTVIPLKSLRILHPEGVFEDTQVGYMDGHVNYLLSRFSHVSWRSYEQIPGVKNLSGALYWEPTAGRLELDSVQTLLKLKDQKPLNFDAVNLAMEWKAQANGWQIHLDRFLLEHAHLILSGRGTLDDYSLAKQTGYLQATAEFSSKDTQTWLPYLPEAYLKPKLAQWLKHDIKHIGESSGRMTVKGALQDFPFDHATGEFNISTSLSDVDLYFHHDWPMVRHIDAALTVDQRRLVADITEADLYPSLPIEHVKVEVAELGLGHDILLVDGRINAPATQMLNYVLNSPLKRKLQKLQTLSVQDPLDLDLALAVPLYPENDEILVKGSLLFDENDAMVHLPFAPLALKHMIGTLFFNEGGVTHSTLQATLFDEQVEMHVDTLHQAKHAATQITWAGDFSIPSLQKQWQMPMLQVMQGHLPLKGVVTLTDAPKMQDRIQLQSDLQGLRIALPSPLGKEKEDIKPFTLQADFDLSRGIQIQSHYADALRAHLWLYGQTQSFKPWKGWLCLGVCPSEMVTKQDTLSTQGWTLKAEFPTLDWDAWGNTMTYFSGAPTSTSFGSQFQTVDLSFGSAAFLGQYYTPLTLSASQQKPGLWKVTMRDATHDIAQLQYQMSQQLLSGQIDQIKLKKPNADEPTPEKHSTFKPSDFPHLSLIVNHLYLDDMALGELSLKGGPHQNSWRLDEGQLVSKPNVLDFQGAWLQQGRTQKTDLSATLHIHDLKVLLEQWHIPPVVEANDGTVMMKGGWHGGVSDFSLKRIQGELSLLLKHGRITHLDPETEHKLGLGKLLSILSLQTIPRRLKLDFSDLANDGYSFDRFEGQFDLNDGVMSTDNSWIDGPVAYAQMKGHLDLIKRLYDLDLHVTPHITASLPVVATIAGGPIAGIATWAASKMLNSGVDIISGYTYTITGPWLEPIVQQVHIYRKKPEPKPEPKV